MALRWRDKVMLLKRETTYDSDPTPAVTDAVLMTSVEITPLESDEVERETIRPYRGAEKTFLVGERVGLKFSVELAGAGGAVDAVPAWGPALRACGLAETINAATSVQYDPVSSGDESCTVYYSNDGQKHAITGLRGNVEVAFEKDKLPSLSFTMIGTYVAPAAASDPVPTLTSWKEPVPATTVNTPTFTLHGYAGILESLDLDLGNDVKRKSRIGDERTDLDDRSSKGSVVIENPALGTKDFFAIVKAETTGALQIIHGVGTGNVIQIDAPNVQLLKPTFSDSDGDTMLNMELKLIPGSGGDDEFKITTT